MRENLQSRSTVLRILGLLVVTVALAVIAATGVATTTLPGCDWCHFRDASFKTATLATPHARTSCVDCHVAKDDPVGRTTFGLYQALGMWVPVLDPSATDATAASDDRCLACHGRIKGAVTQSAGLRIRHSSCAAKNRCVDCHSDVGHGSATRWAQGPAMNDCIACHRQERASLRCETCHVGKIERASFSKPEFTVTHGPNWRQTHGMGQMSACSVCHESSACSKCHGPGVPHGRAFIQDHSKVSQQRGAKCSMCHAKTFCADCHGTEMPHPKTFAAEHSRIVGERGRGTCLRCHATSDCDTCHEQHVHPGGAVGGPLLRSKVTTP